MKLSCCRLVLAALFAAASLHAQSGALPVPGQSSATTVSKTGASSNPLASLGKESKPKTAPAAAKPSKAQLDEVHTVAVLEVEFGGDVHQIMFELLSADAPKTVQNFIQNADKGTYNGLAFHRAVDDYLVQTGDANSKDDAARDQWGLGQEYTIPGEFKLPHVPGAVAMARRGDNVNPGRKSDGTQFYFVLGNMSGLNGQYSVFGQVYSGLDSLKKLSEVATDSNDCPLERVEIKSLKIAEQKGPLISMSKGSKNKRITKPESAKGPLEKVLTRIW